MHFSLPPSHFSQFTQKDLNLDKIADHLDPSDELKILATDPQTNSLKSLDWDHLSQIRKTGELSVPSITFPEQSHVWRLSRLLQKGTENTWNSFLLNLSSALAFLVIRIPDSVSGHWYSISSCLKKIFEAIFYEVPFIFVGLPEYEPFQNSSKLMAYARTFHLLEDAEFQLAPLRQSQQAPHQPFKFTLSGRDYILNHEFGSSVEFRGHHFPQTRSSLRQQLQQLKRMFHEVSETRKLFGKDFKEFFSLLIPHPFVVNQLSSGRNMSIKQPKIELDFRSFFLYTSDLAIQIKDEIEALFNQESNSNLNQWRQTWFTYQKKMFTTFKLSKNQKKPFWRNNEFCY